MEKIKMLTLERIPCWYELSFRMQEPAIALRIHNDFIAKTEPAKDEHPIVKYFIEKFKFQKFRGAMNGNIGFNDRLVFGGINEDFTEYFVNIPRVKESGNKKCILCGGSGKDRYSRDECFHCEGSGKDYIMDWETMFAISASFTVFLRWLQYPKIETPSPVPQLMVVCTITENNMHGGSLGGEYSVELCNWMRFLYRQSGGRYELTEITEAMKAVYKKMLGKFRFGEKHYFSAIIESNNGWLNVVCPGEACGLHPAAGSFGPREGRGYEFSCHNVDNPIQQITLLAGLAALHDKVRREIKA